MTKSIWRSLQHAYGGLIHNMLIKSHYCISKYRTILYNTTTKRLHCSPHISTPSSIRHRVFSSSVVDLWVKWPPGKERTSCVLDQFQCHQVRVHVHLHDHDLEVVITSTAVVVPVLSWETSAAEDCPLRIGRSPWGCRCHGPSPGHPGEVAPPACCPVAHGTCPTPFALLYDGVWNQALY